MPDTALNNPIITLHQCKPFRESVKNMPPLQKELFLREHAVQLIDPSIFELISAKAARVMANEMLPYERYNNADHVINEWYNGDPDLNLPEERIQLRAAIAWTINVFSKCKNFAEVESFYREYFPDGGRTNSSQTTLISPTFLPEHLRSMEFTKGKTLGSELDECLATPLDESGICYAERAARIFKMVARYKAAEEYCFSEQLEMPTHSKNAGISL